jgi:uncharacterized membrane protein YphA (DoxX/SURF4 family)
MVHDRTAVIKRWERWWFPPSSGLNLAVCRILVAGTQVFVFMPFFMASPAEHMALLERGGGFVQPQWMIRVVAAILPVEVVSWPTLVRGAYAVTVAAGLTTLVGWWTRTSAFVFALGTWFLVSHDGSYGEIHHPEIVLAMFLLLLALSPSGRRLSLDRLLRGRDGLRGEDTREAIWPLRLTQTLLAWSYFSNAVAKLAFSGLQWMNGYSLQKSLLDTSLQWDRPLGLWLAQHHGLCVALSVGTVVFELTFPLALFIRKARPFILLLGVVFHLVIYLTMNVAFFQHIVLYAVFVDFEGLASRMRSGRRAPALPGALIPEARA